VKFGKCSGLFRSPRFVSGVARHCGRANRQVDTRAPIVPSVMTGSSSTPFHEPSNDVTDESEAMELEVRFAIGALRLRQFLSEKGLREVEQVRRKGAFGIDGSGTNPRDQLLLREDRKSTRLNSSHVKISYAVFCMKKK